jgi:protein-S-isoprenylcysteine O-methyltransferase Ste14
LRNTKYIAILVSIALIVPIFSYWLAQNMITVVFSIAAVGYPNNLGYVILNLALLCLFVLFTKFRRRAARLPTSIYLAFIIALYVEMYGFPLTMYIMTWLLGYSNPGNLWYFLADLTGRDFFVTIFMNFMLPISNIIIIFGIFSIVSGWKEIFRKKGQLVTSGIYAHVRHPQYMGLLLLTIGINVLWVTISTIILWPILAIMYFRLAKEEEKTMEEKFGEIYRKYKTRVPMFIPRLKDN